MGKRLLDESFWSLMAKVAGAWGVVVVGGCLLTVALVAAVLFFLFVVLPLLLSGG